ncbi:MAG: flavodoxin domain-containing protein, partial [Dokdonella sp.]
MRSTSARTRLLISAVVALLLIAVASWQPYPLPMPADTPNWTGAVAVVLGYLAFCTPFLLRRRQTPAQFRSMPIKSFISASVPATSPAAAAPLVGPEGLCMLVVHASQTGFGEMLAAQTVASLQKAGVNVRSISLGDLDVGMLLLTPRILFIASTTGEGDPPDTAYAFVRKVMSQRRDLSSLSYGLLALGDREYEFYCGFGHQLDSWLREQGALPLFDLIEVDNGDAATLRNWQHQIGALTGAVDLPDWEAPTYSDWQLSERVLLNCGSIGGPVFHVALSDGGLTRWAAGDIVEVGPRNAPVDVGEFLAALQLNGNARISGGEMLKDRLARAALPTLADARNLSAQALADTVTDLPHREYSIASVPEDGSVHLLIRQVRRPDGRLGIGGGWLTEYAEVGSTIRARIRANPNFRAPADARP